MPAENEYLWRQLTYHLAGAGRTAELSELVTQPHWVIDKLRRFGPVAVAEDLALVDTATAKELTRFLDQAGLLLVPGNPSHAVVNALAQRPAANSCPRRSPAGRHGRGGRSKAGAPVRGSHVAHGGTGV